MRILIIEDEARLAELLKKQLSHFYIVDTALNGQSGAHLAEVCLYDLIILDLILPDIHGLHICKMLRTNKILTPVLILTGELLTSDKVETLDAGADDYLTKPFQFAELLARVRALLRRNPKGNGHAVLTVDDLVLDPIKRLAVRGSQVLTLRRKEFDLLEYMMRNQGKVLPRRMILDQVWDDERDNYGNSIDVHIKHLRDQVDKNGGVPLIQTVYGYGYKLVGP